MSYVNTSLYDGDTQLSKLQKVTLAQFLLLHAVEDYNCSCVLKAKEEDVSVQPGMAPLARCYMSSGSHAHDRTHSCSSQPTCFNHMQPLSAHNTSSAVQVMHSTGMQLMCYHC